MNLIFFLLVAIAFVIAAIRQVTFIPDTPETVMPMDAMTTVVVKAAEASVELAIGLIGIMALFLGLMKIVEEAGGLRVIARLMKPLMVKLFPDVPPEHPAMGAMIMNMSANFLGLGNAATPFGIKAMEELNKLNPVQGTATNAMVLFLAINTAGVTLLPTSVVALRAETGSLNPAGIVPTTIFTTIVSCIIAIAAAKLLQRFFSGGQSGFQPPSGVESTETPDLIGDSYPLWMSLLALTGILSLIPLMILYGKVISPWIIPGMIVGMLVIGWARKVPVYEVFISGAKEGFEIAVRIIPYLVAILVSIAMFRESGAMEMIIGPLGAVTAGFGLPAEGLTMGFMRSLSGSGAFGLLASFLENPEVGPDSYTGYLVSTMYGSTETTFYVLAVYFGAVQINRIRHALATGLIADIAAIFAAIVICSILYG